jgi:hypothetical protein
MAQLTLAEELSLLMLRDVDGTYRGGASARNYILEGAAVIELVLRERLSIDEKQRLHILKATETGNEVLDRVLHILQKNARPKGQKYYIYAVSWRMRTLKRRIKERLVRMGLVRSEPRRFLGLIPYTKYFLVDQSTATALRERIHAVLIDGQTPDTRTLALISLLNIGGVLRKQFAKLERSRASKAAKKLAEQNLAITAVSKQIVALNAVVASVAASSSAVVSG